MVQSSAQWAERAKAVLTGPQSNLAPPLPVDPIFVDRAAGHRLWDVEGRDYIDFALTMGPLIFGHGYRPWIDAVTAQLARCPSPLPGHFSSPLEVELGERLVRYIPAAERVKFCLSGTEAVQLVFKLARAFTGRPYVLRFDGHYHGWLDNVLGGELNPNQTEPPHPVDLPQSEHGGFSYRSQGRAPFALKETYKIRWNDIDAFEEVVTRYGSEIALVHMEAIMCNFGGCPPRPGYLEKVRELCTRHGILLCFDEVITGFRVAMGGAQEVTGVTPDLATYGKAVAAGIPFAVVAGKEPVMRLLTDRTVLGAGTFNCYPVAMAASIATLDILAANNQAMFAKVDQLQARLVRELTAMAARYGHGLFTQGPRGQIYLDFMEQRTAWSPDDLAGADHAKRAAFRIAALKNGISIGAGSRMYVSATMSEEDVSEALARFDRTFAALQT